MGKFKKTLSVVLAALMVSSSMAVAASAAPAVGDKGNFSILNYNVSGLPIPASMTEDESDAFDKSILLGEKLNTMGFDIIAVQEDFNYDKFMRDGMTNYTNETVNGEIIARHQSDHSGGVPLGDGLNIFSNYALYNESRVPWDDAYGAYPEGDTLTPKGLMVSTIELEESYYLDVYNLHADAFGSTVDGKPDGSILARRSQFAQLAKYIMKHSVYDETTGTYDHAVIVTGDFNSCIYTANSATDDYLVKNLLEAAHLNDAWAVKTIASITENPADYSAYYDYADVTNLAWGDSWGHYDSVERFCFADGNGIDITCDSFDYVQILDATGKSFSDHSSAQADFSYEIVDKVQDTLVNHDSTNTNQDQSFLLKFLNYLASIFHAIGELLKDYKNWIK